MEKSGERLFGAVVLSVLILCLSTQVIADVGPVAYWRLDEGQGSVAFDYVSNNNGNIIDANWTTGQIGSALSFDGENDYVQVPSESSLDSTTATWSFWVNPMGNPGGSGSSSAETGFIIGRHDSWAAKNGIHISLQPHTTYGTIVIQVKGDSHPSVLVTDTVFSSPELNYNEWSHVAFVFESENFAELYINGLYINLFVVYL